jgi:hypothetical protein
LKGSKLKRIKNSKAGRKFIIAATAFVALAVPTTANAAVNLDMTAGPLIQNVCDSSVYYGSHNCPNDVRIGSFTTISIASYNGWKFKSCTNNGAWDNSYNAIDNPGFFAGIGATGAPPSGNKIELEWIITSGGTVNGVWPVYTGPDATHAAYSCKLIKKVVSYKWVRRHRHRIKVRVVTYLHGTGTGSF